MGTRSDPIHVARHRRRTALVGGLLGVAMLLAACGDDDDDDDGGGDSAPAVTEEEAAAPPATGESSGAGEDACAIALELSEQDGLPTAEQLEDYQDVAPEEISDAVAIAAPPLIAANGDFPSFFAAFADDDVEAAIAEINAWESENCGIEHPENEVGEGASAEIDDGATRVDVTATEYTFDVAEPVTAGRTSFVLTNNGKEAHYLGILKLAEGTDLQTAMESEDGSAIEGSWQSHIAAPGGDDEEVVTLDLAPGTYGLVCFIASADGTPHAFMGMTKEITVT